MKIESTKTMPENDNLREIKENSNVCDECEKYSLNCENVFKVIHNRKIIVCTKDDYKKED